MEMEEPYLEQEPEPLNIQEYLLVLYKRRWMILAIFLIVVISVAVKSYTDTPIYQAQTRLIVENNPTGISVSSDSAASYFGQMRYFETQYNIIQSRAVAREVIRRLDLENSEEFFPKPKGGLFADLRQSVRESLEKAKQSVLSLFRGPDDEKAESSQELLPEETYSSGLVNGIIGRITVKPIKDSNLIDVGFEARSPVLAARIANTVAQVYIDNSLETRLNAIKQAMEWLNQRMDKERKKVDEAENALLQYKQEHGIITDFSSDMETITAQKLSQLNAEVVRAEADRVEAETRYKQALVLKNNPLVSDSIPEVMDNSLIKQIKKTEVELYQQISELSRKYGRNHPKMKAMQSELEEIQKRKAQEVGRIIDTLKNEYEVSAAREQSLKTALEKQKQEVLDLNEKSIQFSVLQRQAQGAREMYEILIKRFKETAATEDIRTSNIRVIDRAEVPASPIKPTPRRNILLAAIVGLVLGVGVAFLIEFLDNTLKTPDEAEKAVGVPCLGLLPLIDMAPSPRNESDGSLPELVTVGQSRSTVSEAFRTIRTKILFSSAVHQPRIILLSSAGPKEGKTFVSGNLAVTMAQTGNRVLVIDCDMRRPRMHKLFGLEKEPGLSNLLVGDCDRAAVIQDTPVPNLWMIPCGLIPPNPSELLGSDKMADLLKDLSQEYDRIVLDTPPLASVSDAAVLSRLADVNLMILYSNRTTRNGARNGVELIRSVGAQVAGTILNSVDLDRNAYYYQYYYYYYGYYYGEDGERKNRKGRRGRRRRRSEEGETLLADTPEAPMGT
jgi:polysaccharide biosynthesis transport protein